MSALRSFVSVRKFALGMRRFALPGGLRHLWAAIVMHALAGLIFDGLHGSLARWPAAFGALLLGSLLVWVVPLARRPVLQRAGEMIVLAGVLLVVAIALGVGAELLRQVLAGGVVAVHGSP